MKVKVRRTKGHATLDAYGSVNIPFYANPVNVVVGVALDREELRALCSRINNVLRDWDT